MTCPVLTGPRDPTKAFAKVSFFDQYTQPSQQMGAAHRKKLNDSTHRAKRIWERSTIGRTLTKFHQLTISTASCPAYIPEEECWSRTLRMPAWREVIRSNMNIHIAPSLRELSICKYNYCPFVLARRGFPSDISAYFSIQRREENTRGRKFMLE